MRAETSSPRYTDRMKPDSTSLSLLQRLRQPGDGAAWERLTRLYTPLLCFWLRRAGAQEQDAADVVQDVFVALLAKLPTFDRDKGGFRSWLRAVTLNKWRDRRRARRPELLGPGVEVEAGDEVELFAEDEYRRHVVAQAMELARASFEERTWRACWEHVAKGRPAAEVAAELGTTAGAVYAAAFRVLGKLRRELDGLLD